MIETDRSGLVGGYVGQTALKTRAVIDRAIGGILFIDEAHALRSDHGADYGQEAIEVILKVMEDHRDDLVVIVAGYPELMELFIESNPGLKSRFTKYLYFEDYSPEQLLLIFERFCRESDYQLAQRARTILAKSLGAAYDARDGRFGNARHVRNMFERAIANLATRIVSMPRINDEIQTTIVAEDVRRL